MLTEKAEHVAADQPVVAKIAEKRRALGRGLDTLLPGGPRASGGASAFPAPAPITSPTPAERKLGEEVIPLPLDEISPNPYQTRTRVDESYLAQLAESISTHGVLQPVTVRPGPGGKYLLIAGECRWRASKQAGKSTIPAIVRVVSDQQALELTIIENLQRADLNCVDQAMAFQRLSQEFRLTQEEIAIRTGVNRSTVSNYLRLVRLPEPIQQKLRDGSLTFGHAKVLMSVNDQEQMVRMSERAVEGLMSVRKLEEWVLDLSAPDGHETKPTERRYVDPNVRQAQADLERALGLRVKIRDSRGKGSILLQYRNLEDFDRVVGMLSRK
jgi:ParB family chromosome partitioning protein